MDGIMKELMHGWKEESMGSKPRRNGSWMDGSCTWQERLYHYLTKRSCGDRFGQTSSSSFSFSLSSWLCSYYHSFRISATPSLPVLYLIFSSVFLCIAFFIRRPPPPYLSPTIPTSLYSFSSSSSSSSSTDGGLQPDPFKPSPDIERTHGRASTHTTLQTTQRRNDQINSTRSSHSSHPPPLPPPLPPPPLPPPPPIPLHPPLELW